MNKFAIAGVAAIILIGGPIACSVLSTTASVTTAPGRVVSETFRTGNILSTYEGFFDTKAQYESRVAQIAERESLIREEKDSNEMRRMRIELSATRQSCRELAQTYNADAQKNNDSLFLDRDLPTRLNPQACE